MDVTPGPDYLNIKPSLRAHLLRSLWLAHICSCAWLVPQLGKGCASNRFGTWPLARESCLSLRSQYYLIFKRWPEARSRTGSRQNLYRAEVAGSRQSLYRAEVVY
jgi:hypothetical protein